MARLKTHLLAAVSVLSLALCLSACAGAPADIKPPDTADSPVTETADPTPPGQTAGQTPEPPLETPAEVTPPETNTPENEPGSGIGQILKKPAVLFGGIGVICVIAAALTYAVVRKRRKGKASAVAAAPRSPAAGLQAANIQGIGSRESQQDSFGITDIADWGRGVFAVVADGMGGTVGGAEISRITTAHMLQIFQSSSNSGDPAALLLHMVSGAQDKARAYIEWQGNQTSGSTVVAAIVKAGGLYFVSVGDSRICLLRGGALVQLNREHTCASRLDERAARGEISLDEARNDPQRAALTSYIGLDGQPQIDSNQKPIAVAPGDRLLLMSDGIFGTLTDAELVSAAGLQNIQEAGAAIERAIKAKQKPNQDNFTAILLAF